MRRFILLLAVTMTGLSACGSVQTGHPRALAVDRPPGASDIVAGRFVRAAELDHGQLKVSPAPRSTRPAITENEAAILSGSDPAATGTGGAMLLGFGVVTVQPGLNSNLQRAPAWVAVVRGAVFSCPNMPAGRTDLSGVTLPPAPTTTQPHAPTPGYVAVIMLDAHRVFDYRSRGSACDEPVGGPTVSAASETLSVPWKLLSRQAGKVTFRYQAPSCFAQATPSIELDGNTRTALSTLTVELTVPFDRVSCPGTWKQMMVAVATPRARLTPSPVGPVAILHGWAGERTLGNR